MCTSLLYLACIGKLFKWLIFSLSFNRRPAELDLATICRSQLQSQSLTLNCPNNGLQPLHYRMLISFMINQVALLRCHTPAPRAACTAGVLATMCLCKPHIPSQLIPHRTNLLFIPPLSFLPYLTSIPHFLSHYSAALSRLFSQGLYWSQGKKGSAAAGHSFLQSRYRGAESSLHERAPFLQLYSTLPLPPLFTKALLCQEQGSKGRRKKKGGISLFTLCTPHGYTSISKASTNELATALCERRES